MGIMSRFTNALGFTKAAKTVNVAQPSGISITADTSDAGFSSSLFPASGTYIRDAAVRTVVDYIARNIASLPAKVYVRDGDGGRSRVRGTGLSNLMERPSVLPGVTRYDFLYSVVCDMLLYDRWLCILGVDARGEWRLRRIPPRKWSLRGNTLDEIVAVRVSTDTETREYELPDDRVILSKGFSESGVNGAPMNATLAPLLAEARAMEEYRRDIAANAAHIPAYITRPAGMPWASQEQQDAFVQMLRAYRQGGGREGGWPLLSDGMEIKSIDGAYKPVDVDDLEARQQVACRVAEAFHVSPELVGFREGTASNLSELRARAWSVELMPYIVAIEQSLNLDLPRVVGEPDAYVEFDVDSKMRGTLEEQYQALSTATGRSFLTTNEARERLNLPHVPGGDELVTPLNVLVGGEPSPQDGGETVEAQRGNL